VTGSKGLHFYFECPTPPVGSLTGKGATDGIDLRCSRGYAVAPPSVHKSGELYHWVPGRAPWERPLPPAPDWIAEYLRLTTQSATTARAPMDVAKVLAQWKPGAAWLTIASLAGKLAACGVPEEMARGLLIMANRAACGHEANDKKVARHVAWVYARDATQRRTSTRHRAVDAFRKTWERQHGGVEG
jgi:hypothetical protein